MNNENRLVIKSGDDFFDKAASYKINGVEIGDSLKSIKIEGDCESPLFKAKIEIVPMNFHITAIPWVKINDSMARSFIAGLLRKDALNDEDKVRAASILMIGDKADMFIDPSTADQDNKEKGV